VLKRKNPRPTLNLFDRVFWIMLRRMWSRWTDALVIVKPEPVVGWHRARFGRLLFAMARRSASRASCAGQITLVPVGPLTNIAMAFLHIRTWHQRHAKSS
jgi:hypothetical protein